MACSSSEDVTVETFDLVHLLPLLWGPLGPDGLRNLRATCPEMQRAVDGRVNTLEFTEPAAGNEGGLSTLRTSPTDAVSCVQRLVDRGGRPRALVLRLQEDRSADDREQLGHGVLAALAAAPNPRPLEYLALQGVPLSADLVAAIAAAAPEPQQLELYVHHSLDDGTLTDEAAAEVAAVAAVVRSTAPGLRRLTLWCNPTVRCDGPLGLQLVGALQDCHNLERLTLWTRDAGCTPWEALCQFPCLRTMELRDYDDYDAPPECGLRAGIFDADLPQDNRFCQPSGLTHLAIDHMYDLQEIVPYLPNLGTLTVLHLWNASFTPGDRQLLQSLPSLQRMALASIHAENWRVAPRPSPLPLPPRLQSLHVTGVMDPRVLLALQLPPSLTRLVVQGLSWEGPTPGLNRPLLEGSRACNQFLEHMEAALAGLRLLADSGLFDSSALRRPFVLSNFPLENPYGIPGGFRALAAALGRLGLCGIENCEPGIETRYTDPAWFEAVAEEMPDLQELQWTEVQLSDLAILRRLRRLRQVRLFFSEATNLGDIDQLCGILFDFVAALPDLKRLFLLLWADKRAEPCVRRALTRLQRDFRTLGGRAPVYVKVWNCIDRNIPPFYLGGVEDVNLVDGPGSVVDGESYGWIHLAPLSP